MNQIHLNLVDGSPLPPAAAVTAVRVGLTVLPLAVAVFVKVLVLPHLVSGRAAA